MRLHLNRCSVAMIMHNPQHTPKQSMWTQISSKTSGYQYQCVDHIFAALFIRPSNPRFESWGFVMPAHYSNDCFSGFIDHTGSWAGFFTSSLYCVLLNCAVFKGVREGTYSITSVKTQANTLRVTSAPSQLINSHSTSSCGWAKLTVMQSESSSHKTSIVKLSKHDWQL